jgi:4,5-dihydroxyphthalate decarboxylase
MLRLTVATGPYDRTAALRDGRVRPEGIELNCLPLKVEEIFWRMMQHREFDVSELSFSGYTVRRGRGETDLTAIPVFLSRSFRQNILYVPADSDVTDPAELAGKRVGVPEYQMTAAVWVRGFMEDDFGVAPESVHWVQGGLEQWGRKPFEPVSPPGVTIEASPEGSALARMLADGELDALISPRVPSTFADGSIRRLFPDPAAAERDYYARTGIFPIMHTVAIKTEIVEANPWVPQTLFKAFVAARDLAYAALNDTTAHQIQLPFLATHVAETEELMGPDFWPYGLEENRHTLETFLRHAARQGMVPGDLTPEDLFPETTYRQSRI